MTIQNYLEKYPERIERMSERVLIALDGFDQPMLNMPPAPNTWNCGQVIDHLIVSNTGYLGNMQTAIEGATRSKENPEIAYSFIGKQVIKNAGPNGNFPVPRGMEPRLGIIELDLIERWKRDMDVLGALAKMSVGINLNKVKFPNPIMKLMKMRLSDGFEILAEHTERHVRQIEDRAKIIRARSQ